MVECYFLERPIRVRQSRQLRSAVNPELHPPLELPGLVLCASGVGVGVGVGLGSGLGVGLGVVPVSLVVTIGA